ncbi:hypothetical protein C9439_03585 [archaeon SCG-AAA382B04]|nr:hypothetical protein C9439_03585 [archaeon SCG-AAA382B04]
MVWGIIGTLVGFALVVALVRRNVDFSVSIFAGTIFIAITNSFTPEMFVSSIAETALSVDTHNLLVLVIFINIIGLIMERTGQINDVVESFKTLFSSRGTAGAIPTVIGLLPMPGGALMSAPIMDQPADELGADAEEKTLINFWFRHFIYFIYPFSPDLALAASSTEVTVTQLAIANTPIFILTTILGYFFFIRKMEKGERKHSENRLLEVVKIIYWLSPILIAVLIKATTGIKLMFIVPIALLLLVLQNLGQLTPNKFFGYLQEGFPVKLAVAVFGIMFFRQTILMTNSLDALVSLARGVGVPLELIVFFVPFLIGLVLGIGLGAIALSFPLITPLMDMGDPLQVSALFIACYLGYLVSPVHLCLVVTKDYFDSNLKQDLIGLLKPVSFLILYLILLILVAY